ncbi:hypothetical protein AS25_10905 [Kocuria marina]|uniref:DUF8175 domain-containing protein n=1 Tax=Kocuria marina TaxID=223184 RepID=A0A0B0D8L8_9MICC|nr:hypothetical protein [Kocuria marina]KHE73763.1 hypothetical protein AS25_10905 [Kocuria marina]
MNKTKTRNRSVAAVTVGLASLLAVSGCSHQPTEDYAYACQSDLDHGDTSSVSKKAPETDSWAPGKDGVRYPVSAKFGGCQDLSSGWKVGHAHNTAGALFAATDYLAGPTKDEQKNVSEEDTKSVYAAGKVRDQIIADGKKPKTPAPTGEGYVTESPGSEGSAQLRGYEIQEESADKVHVLLYGQSDSVLSGTFGLTMVWQDGDWKLDPVSADKPMELQMTTTSDPAVTWSA